MNMKEKTPRTFAGVTHFGNEQLYDWEEVYTDTYETIRTFKHIEKCEQCDGKSILTMCCDDDNCIKFNYKYLVSAIDLYDATGEDECEDKYYVELYMVPTAESLSSFRYNDVLECCGSVDSMAIKDYGYAVFIGGETVHESIMESTIESAKIVTNFVDSMFGFYMDRTINLIGTTGWDVIKYAIGKTGRLF